MIPYILANGDLEVYHLLFMEMSQVLVNNVNGTMILGNPIRCHELARAVLLELPPEARNGDDRLFVQDGRVDHIEHSWLRFAKSGHIIDTYRPGVLPSVMLVDSFIAMGTYKLDSPRTDISATIVKRLREEMRK